MRLHKLRVKLAYRLLRLAMWCSDTPLRQIQVDNRRLVGERLRGVIHDERKLRRSELRAIYDYHVRTQKALRRLMRDNTDE